MRITIGISTYNRPDILRQCVLAILSSDIWINKVIVIDNSLEQYATAVLSGISGVEIITQSNIGLAASLNYLFENNDDYIITPNDDILVHTHTVRAMINAAAATNDAIYFGYKDAYSFFLLKKAAWERVGRFSLEYFPLYFDDNDLAYRLKLMNYTHRVITEATFEHLHGGSSTLKAYTVLQAAEHHSTFERNKNHYIAKWGGLPGNEVYITPFNK